MTTTKTNHNSSIQHKQVIWHSRRGMLELDILLIPFARDVFPTLNEKEQNSFIRLLAKEDTELFAWFVNYELASQSELEDIITQVRNHATPCTPTRI